MKPLRGSESGPVGRIELVSSCQLPVSRSETDWFPASGSPLPDCGEENLIPTAREISKGLGKKWPEVKGELEHLGCYLSKGSLVKAITILSEARKRRFLRSKRPKYGSMNKGFTEEELERFFSVIDDPKAHLLFSFQAILGLRIGEAVRVNIQDINLKTRELRIFTEKSGKTDYLLIPEKLFEVALRYIAAFEKEIAAYKGYLFFSIGKGRRTQESKPHITTQTARFVFRDYMKKAKLAEVYGYSVGAGPRQLYRLSPHSLRHYAITNFCRKNGGNAVLASKFARHTNLQTTMVYIHTEKEELYESIERAHDTKILERVRAMQEKM